MAMAEPYKELLGAQVPDGCRCMPACRSQRCVLVQVKSLSHVALEAWKPNRP